MSDEGRSRVDVVCTPRPQPPPGSLGPRKALCGLAWVPPTVYGLAWVPPHRSSNCRIIVAPRVLALGRVVLSTPAERGWGEGPHALASPGEVLARCLDDTRKTTTLARRVAADSQDRACHP